MKRFILTERQLNLIIENQVDETVLNEGPKEWLLAGLVTLASMAGLSQDKSKEFDPTRVKAAELVQNRLESGDKEIYNLFDKANIDLNKQNLDKLKSVDVDGAKMDVVKTGSERIAKEKLKQGYVLSDIKITSDTILKRGDVVYMGDTITLDYSSDAAFKTASYELTDNYKQTLLETINNINSINGKIINVKVESSTDKEPIKMGNEKLAELRSNSVVDVLSGVGISGVETVNLPNQGPDVYSRTMSTQERTEARKETAEFRYVRVTIEYEVEYRLPNQEKVKEVIETQKYEMIRVKPKQEFGGGYKFKGKDSKRTVYGEPKCKKVKYDNKMVACPAIGKPPKR